MFLRRTLTLLYFIFILLIACKNDPPPEPPKTAEQLIKEAWVQFESHNYSYAITIFSEAIALDYKLAEAYMGLGWSYGKIDSLDLAISNFKIAIILDVEEQYIDIYAGYAFVCFHANEFSQAITAAKKVIERYDEVYIFLHDPTITTSDIRLLLAQCYFETGEYYLAQAQVDILDPDNNLDPYSSNYIEELAAFIESLSGNV